MKNLLYNIFSSRMESNAALEMQLLDIINAYNTSILPGIPIDKLNEEAEKIYTEEPNVNSYDEEHIGELFSIDNYGKQRLVLELIYYIVGTRHAQESEKVTIQQLDKWGDAVMRHGFYIGFNLRREDISRLITEIEANPKYIDANTRDINHFRSDYANFNKKEFGEDLTEDKILEKIHPYNDGAYTELPVSINTMVLCCIENGWFDLWLAIYELLTYAPLQGRMIYDLQTIEQLIGVVEAENKQHVKRHKIFANLLSNRAFELFIRQQDFLERNARNEELNNTHIELAKEALALWKTHRSEYMNALVKEFLGVMSMDDVLAWLSEKNRMASAKRGIYKERDINLIHDIWEATQTQKGVIPIDVDKSDLNTLLSYVYNTDIEKLAQDTCNEIIQAICKHIYTDEQIYVGWDFSDESIKQMRAVYACLVKSGQDFIGLARRYLLVNEGYKTTLEKHIKLQQAHKIWLSAMMLQIEDAQDSINEFARNEHFMFECAYKSDVDLMDYYTLPFLIGEAVVLQIAKEHGKVELKDLFEAKLINTINDLLLVIIVLSLNEGEISNANETKLIQRINKEWDTAIAMNPHNPNVKICEQYIKKHIQN